MSIQFFHQQIGGIYQCFAVMEPGVFKAVHCKAKHHHIFAFTEAVGYQIPVSAGLAVYDPLSGGGSSHPVGGEQGEGTEGEQEKKKRGEADKNFNAKTEKEIEEEELEKKEIKELQEFKLWQQKNGR